MTMGLRLSRVLSASWPAVDPLRRLRRMDAAYRERRRMEELSPELLRDVGLTRGDISRMLGQ
jgi:uncharacterized protein YjiS (DUF1127 family)